MEYYVRLYKYMYIYIYLPKDYFSSLFYLFNLNKSKPMIQFYQIIKQIGIVK